MVLKHLVLSEARIASLQVSMSNCHSGDYQTFKIQLKCQFLLAAFPSYSPQSATVPEFPQDFVLAFPRKPIILA